MTQRDRLSAPPFRRRFLLHGFAMTGAALVACLARRATAGPGPQAEALAVRTGDPASNGYAETPHVRTYYAKARN